MTDFEHAQPARSRLVATLLFGAVVTSGWFFIVVAVAPLFDEPILVSCALMLALLAASACGLLHALGFFRESPDHPYHHLDVEEDSYDRGPVLSPAAPRRLVAKLVAMFGARTDAVSVGELDAQERGSDRDRAPPRNPPKVPGRSARTDLEAANEFRRKEEAQDVFEGARKGPAHIGLP